MIVLDTAVLAYAVGGDHPLRGPADGLLGAVSDRRVRASTTVEVIQEFVHISTRRLGRAVAVGLARDFADLLAPLLYPKEDELRIGLDIYEASQRVGAFDAVLSAVARSRGNRLVSSDRDFAEVTGLDFVRLGAVDVADLIDR